MNIIDRSNEIIPVNGNDLDEVRAYLALVEKLMLESPTKIDLPITHHFSHHVYAREMNVPEGMAVMGRIHRFENLNIISAGEAVVLSQDGVMHVKAPFTYVGTPGAKRLIIAVKPLTWTCVIGTESKDPDEIEERYTALNFSELEKLA